MSEYYQISEAPLTPSESNKLRLTLILIPSVFGTFSGIIFYFIGSEMTSFGPGPYILTAFGIFFFGILFFIIRLTYLDWKSGVKQIIKGIVTQKEHNVSRTSGKNKNTTHSYYLWFDDFKLKVDSLHHDIANEGDLFEFHYGKNTQMIFHYEKLKANAMQDLKASGAKMTPPTIAKKMSFGAALLIFLGLILVVLTCVFWAISDCFSCQDEYPETVGLWQNVEYPIQGNDQISREANEIIMMLNDTLRDEEEGQIATKFNALASQQLLVQVIDKLDSLKPQNDDFSALLWIKKKYDEANIINKLTVPELWQRTLYAISSYDGFRPDDNLKVDDHKISELDACLFRDDAISVDHLNKWYSDLNTYELQFSMYEYLNEDTTIYSSGANQFLLETYKNGGELSFKNAYIKERAKTIYGY